MRRWLPHVVSLSRIPTAFALLITYNPFDDPLSWASGLFASAAVTDKLDGILARYLRTATYEGYLIDGLADRVLSVACILLGVIHHGLPLWVALAAVARELLMYTIRLIDPSGWHPVPRATRIHSLITFGTTRIWFAVYLVLGSDFREQHAKIECILNSTYATIIIA